MNIEYIQMGNFFDLIDKYEEEAGNVDTNFKLVIN